MRLCMTGGAVSLAVMLIPLLRSLGFSSPAAAQVAALLGIAALAGRLGTGFLLDRFSGNIVAGSASLLPVVACLLLLKFPGSIDAAVVAVIFLGLSTGSELDATAFLASRHLGLRRFATLYAFIGSSMALATGVGPILVSHVYDLSHSYTQAIWLVMPASMLAAGLLYSLGRTPGRTQTGRIAPEGAAPVTVPI